MKNKTVVITGGNDGIGFHTALELARKGAALILVCRNEEKAREAVRKIISDTVNNNVTYVIGDMLSQQSVRTVAAEIKATVERIDVLVNNAGGVFSEFQLTPDGLERTIALNHFAYFLLTGLLLDLVNKSEYARIINVSSGSHYLGKIDFASFRENTNYSLFKAYRQSKLANVLFTFELADRLGNSNITVNCLHPGTVRTNIANKQGKLISWAWTMVTLLSMDAAAGAKTSIYLASSPEVNGITGKYFDKCKPKEPRKVAYDSALRKKLWEVSEKLTGIGYP